MENNNSNEHTFSVTPEWLREYFLMDQELVLLKELLVRKATPTTIEALLSYLESEQALLPTLNTLIRQEIASCSDMTTLFREESPTTLLLSVCYSLKVSRKYLKKSVRPVIKQVMALPNSLEVKVSDTITAEMAANNGFYLTVLVNQLLKQLEDELLDCPYFIRYALNILQTEVVEKYPLMKYSVIGGFFFLRYICPSLVTPEKYNLIEPLSPNARRTMILVSKIIQNMGIGRNFDIEMEPFMEPFNNLIASKNSDISAFFTKITDRREMNRAWKAEKTKHRASNSKTITSKQKLILKSAVEELHDLIVEVVERIDHLVPNIHPKFWSYVDVFRWVNNTHINDGDAELFVKAKIDGKELLTLDKSRLEQIGISKLGQRMKYTKLINNLRDQWQNFEAGHIAGLQQQLNDLNLKDNDSSVVTWSPHIVKLWCQSKGLDDVGNELYKEGVTGRNLLSLDNEDLISFGIFNPRWRNYLLNLVNQLRADNEMDLIKQKKNFYYINCHIGLNYTETLNIPKSKPQLQKIMQQLEIHHGSGLELIYKIKSQICYINDNTDLQTALKWMKEGNILEFIARNRLHKPMVEWNCYDVQYWLATLDIVPEPPNAICTYNITGVNLTSDPETETIKSWGITKLGHIKRLQKNIKEYTKKPTLLSSDGYSPNSPRDPNFHASLPVGRSISDTPLKNGKRTFSASKMSSLF